MTAADAIREATANRQRLIEEDERGRRARASDRDARERARAAEAAALRRRKAALEDQPEPPPEKPVWGVLPPGRSFARFLFLARGRADGVGRFARMAASDASFPGEASTVLTYLKTRIAPDEVLDWAREAVRDYRTWWLEGLELAFREIENV